MEVDKRCRWLDGALGEKEEHWVIEIGILVVVGLVLCRWGVNPERVSLASQREHAPESFVSLSRGVVCYDLVGESTAPLVVLVHGFGTPSGIFVDTASVLADAGYQVLRFDLYGRGMSERLETHYRLDDFEEQLDELLRVLELPAKFHLLGLSMGGTVAASYASRNPERLNKLILMAPLVTSMEIGNLKYKMFTKLFLPVLSRVFPGRQVRGVINPARHRELYAMIQRQMTIRGTAKSLVSIARSIAACDHQALFRRVGELHIPTLIVWGREDPVVPFENHALACELTGGHLVEIPDAGHLAHYEQPEQVHGHCLDFLREDLHAT